MTLSHGTAQTSAGKLSLDGEWFFRADSLKRGMDDGWYAQPAVPTDWRIVPVPEFWETYPGLAGYDGWGWFAKTIRLDSIAGPMSLHCAGVDDDVVVWVNDIEVGSHAGYSDPFALDVSGALRIGENRIVLLVKDYAGGGGIYKPVTLVETKYLDELLKGPYFGMPALQSADWVKDACIYSVYLRSFSPEGTFSGLEKRIPELKDLGATVLWLLPIHPVGEKNRKGTLGSPYAVKDYYGINPEFGTMKDFKRLLHAAHRNGMKLIIDLVANHTSWDSKLIMEHPEWFTKDKHGNILAPNADWTDVADLDYSQPGLRRYMIRMMKWWVEDIGIDGFRCDVAELVPTDFWNEARTVLNTVKPVMMLSEGSLPEHHLHAFDLTYSWNVYDVLDLLLKGKQPVTLLDQIFRNERLQFPVGSLRMRFTTNHDKNAWDIPAVDRYGRAGLKLATVLVNTIPGVPMIYTGEEVANDRKLSLFEKVGVDWSRTREVGGIYKSLFRLRNDNKALSRGSMMRIATESENDVYAFARTAGEEGIIVVLNFSDEPRQITVHLPTELLRAGSSAKDLFTGEVIRPGNEPENRLSLNPKGYKVFVIQQ